MWADSDRRESSLASAFNRTKFFIYDEVSTTIVTTMVHAMSSSVLWEIKRSWPAKCSLCPARTENTEQLYWPYTVTKMKSNTVLQLSANVSRETTGKPIISVSYKGRTCESLDSFTLRIWKTQTPFQGLCCDQGLWLWFFLLVVIEILSTFSDSTLATFSFIVSSRSTWSEKTSLTFSGFELRMSHLLFSTFLCHPVTHSFLGQIGFQQTMNNATWTWRSFSVVAEHDLVPLFELLSCFTKFRLRGRLSF